MTYAADGEKTAEDIKTEAYEIKENASKKKENTGKRMEELTLISHLLSKENIYLAAAIQIIIIVKIRFGWLFAVYFYMIFSNYSALERGITSS